MDVKQIKESIINQIQSITNSSESVDVKMDILNDITTELFSSVEVVLSS